MRNWMVGVVLLTGCVDAVNEGTTEQASSQVMVSAYTMNGGGAWAQATNPAPWRYYMIDVFESGTGQNKQAYLNFSGTIADESTLVCDGWFPWPMCSYSRFTTFFGSGPITGLQLSPRGASLHATLPPGFHSERCVSDTVAGTYECTSLVGETVELMWTQSNEFFSYSHSGTSEQKMGPYTFRTVGTQHNSGATATGTLAGLVIDGMGTINSTRGANISKVVFKTN